MPLRIVRDDLVNMSADAVVVPANEQLRIDGGAGGAVARRAGVIRLRHACRKLGGCPTGSAVATGAYKFPAKHLIHAVGPVWRGRGEDERLLRSAYDAALELAAKLGCRSVALPLLSAGLYGCPSHVSLACALSSIEAFLHDRDLEVVLVLYDKAAVAAGLDFLGDLESRIDDAYARDHAYQVDSYYASLDCSAARLAPAEDASDRWTEADLDGDGVVADWGTGVDFAEAPAAATFEAAMPTAPTEAQRELPPDKTGRIFGSLREAPAKREVPFGGEPEAWRRESRDAPDEAASDLEHLLDNMDEGFSRTLLGIIDESGMTDAQVYRRANMSRQHFSKIRSNAGYRPSKPTVLALCVALELDIDQTRDLLGRAGFALSHASKFDIIVEYFIEHAMYDPFAINEALFYFDQPLLGGG